MYSPETLDQMNSPNKTRTLQKEKKVYQSRQFVSNLRVTGSIGRSELASFPRASPRWVLPQNSCFVSAFWNLLDQRPGLIIVATLVGFVLFDLSHVL